MYTINLSGTLMYDFRYKCIKEAHDEYAVLLVADTNRGTDAIKTNGV